MINGQLAPKKWYNVCSAKTITTMNAPKIIAATKIGVVRTAIKFYKNGKNKTV